MPAKTQDHGVHYFESPRGECALTWGPRGLTGVHLPEADPADLRAAVERRCGPLPSPRPPAEIRALASALRAMLAGGSPRPPRVRLDWTGFSPFQREVFEALRGVPRGQVVSYGELAARAGRPGAARAVGQVMRRNRFPMLVPCHRVVGAGGKPGGFSAHGELDTKAALLALEGVALHRRRPRGMAYDPHEAAACLREADAALARIMDAVGPPRLEAESRSPYQSLFRAIVYQQLSGKAAGTILGRVRDLFPGSRIPAPEELLATRDEDLRGAGLSRAKVAAVRDLAARALDGTVPELRRARRLSDQELIERLTAVRGVGQWTVEMLLIFGLGRPDILPVDDLGIRKGFARMTRRKQLPDKQVVLRRGERWRPYRSLASWYLWRATELG